MSTLTIKDIAKICKVSTSTVSRAINGDSGINKNTRDRILEAIKEHDYVPNNSARNLKMLDTNTVALLIKGIDNPFFQNMLRVFEAEFKKLDYSFIIQSVGTDQDAEVAAQLIKEKKLKGIIFLGGRIDRRGGGDAVLGVPYVRCTGAAVIGDTSWQGATVAIDDFEESRHMVDYLCSRGHKKVAIITTGIADRSVGKLRYEGYLKALSDHGIEADENLVCHMLDDEFSVECGYQAAKSLLDSGREFTALYAISDMIAFGAYKAIQESGKRIPEDYSVVGFDGMELAKYFNPSLTTIKQPMESLVKASIEELVKGINDEKTSSQVIFKGTLIEGGSVRDL